MKYSRYLLPKYPLLNFSVTNPLTIQEFSANNNEKFLEDFANIPHGDESSKTAGQQEENQKKNRYQNVIPYDLSRVKLVLKKNTPYSEYINASFINGCIQTLYFFSIIPVLYRISLPNPATVVEFFGA